MTSILAALAVVTLWRLSPFHPAQLWSIPWALAALLYLAHLLPYRRIDAMTAVVACGSSVAFVGGAVIGDRIGNRLTSGLRQRSFVGVRLAATVALGVTALLLCAFLVEATRSFGVRATLVSSQTVRDAIGVGEFQVTIKYVYAALAATALCAIAAARASRSRVTRWHVLAIASILSIYFATGRATLVVAMVVALVAYGLARPTPMSRRTFIAGSLTVGALAVFVFIVGGSLIGKTFENNPGLQAVPSQFTKHRRFQMLALPYEYVTAPIAALDVQVDTASTWGTAHGCAAFSEFCTIAQRLGSDHVRPVPRIRPFTREPLPWNTYTALDVPLMDGGVALVIPIVGVIGGALGALWALARRRSILALCAYALLAPAAVTASGSFTFTAPHVVGSILLAAVALTAARLSITAGRNPVGAPPRVTPAS